MSMATLQQFFKSPSAYTLAATILTGAGLYYSMLGRLDRIEDRMTAQAVKDTAQDIAIDKLGNGLAAAKTEFGAQLTAIQRDVAETKTSIRGVEVSVDWIARSISARPAAAPRGQLGTSAQP